MNLFTFFIVLGLLLMGAGIVLAVPDDASLSRILTGVVLCWISLPCFWLAKQVERR